MGNVVCNSAKGRAVELYNRVENNDPTNSAFIFVALKGSETDDNCRDAATLTALIATALDEVTNSGYARKTFTDADLAALPSPDNTNNWYAIDLPDIDFGAITAGDNWTRLAWVYDPDTTSGTDANTVMIGVWDFVITTDGTNVTARIDTNGAFRAS